jgi:cytochrome c oxidase subunit 2
MLARWIIALAAAAALAASPAQAPPAQEPAPQVIEMTAKKYEYAPAEIRVKVGTRVQLKLRALDRTHGLEFELYPEGAKKSGDPGLVFSPAQKNFKIEKDQERVIEFTAARPGTYNFKCSVFCGFGHRGMRGKLIVED